MQFNFEWREEKCREQMEKKQWCKYYFRSCSISNSLRYRLPYKNIAFLVHLGYHVCSKRLITHCEHLILTLFWSTIDTNTLCPCCYLILHRKGSKEAELRKDTEIRTTRPWHTSVTSHTPMCSLAITSSCFEVHYLHTNFTYIKQKHCSNIFTASLTW